MKKMNSKIKLVVLINGSNNYKWQHVLIQKIIKLDFVELSSLIICAEPKTRLSAKKAVIESYMNFESFILAKMMNAENYWQKADLNTFDTKLSLIKCTDKKEIKAKLKDSQVDLILNLTDLDGLEEIAQASNFGMWHSKEFNNAIAQIVNNIYDNKHTLDIELTDTNTKTPIFSTNIGIKNYFFYLNLHRILTKLMNSIVFKLEALYITKDSNALTSNIIASDQDNKPDSLDDINLFKLFYKLSRNLFKDIFERAFYNEQWFLGVRTKESILNDFNKDDFNFITPLKDKIYADPFIIEENGKQIVFIEEMLFSNQKGVLSCFEIDENGQPTEPKCILDKGYHLSYPFVFKDNGKYYMIPESAQNNSIDLYEAVDFPYKWELKKNLFNNLMALDTTLLHRNNKYWLFFNKVTADCMTFDELHIYYSDSLLGEWKPHAKNPVIADSKTARPAGKFFTQDGMLIRPSQDCSVRYGYALNFNRVDLLTETEYKESFIKKVTPEFIDKNLSVHTFNNSNKYEILDGMRYIKK